MKSSNTTYFDILIRIRKIIRSISLDSKKLEKNMGLSIPQLLLLRFLSEKEGFKATASEIGAHLRLNASTATGIINRMIDKGLVAKTISSKDRRVRMIILTAQGYAVLQDAPETIQDRVTKRLSKLSEEEREILDRGMDLLVKILDAEEIEAAPIITPGELAD